ncbi:MAG TPA: peptide deformylase [Candidatus Fimadaptatus faecigallinarum]|uniref:Peptide deformylase n=1 Tax=Candidatus Fimadaptatus faecigallinarum TaxID=2840814 RepID=A0A9D1LQ48_9FIRM|nr:peptide deformylase [Candidatus Fimadaptatus faecigallinarum]
MAIRRIIKEGDDTLRRISRPVKQIDKRILTLLDDMRQTMYVNDGCGLAAPQVGILRRVVVVDVGDELYELINPEIIESSGEIVDSEGCLSVPGRRGKVARPEKVTVRALNRRGELKEYTGTGLLARAFCHEIDHLDGILYLDKMIEEVFEDEE